MKWKSSRPDLVMLAVVVLLAAVFITGTIAFIDIFAETPGATDFVGRWQAAKNLVFNQASPLSKETDNQINSLISHRDIPEYRENYHFMLPYFSILPYLPFAFAEEVVLASALWTVACLVLLLAIGMFSVHLSGWEGSWITWPAWLLLLAFGFPFTLAVWNGDLVLVAIFVLFISLGFLVAGKDGMAGIFFGLSLVKPPLVILIYPYILIWAVLKGRARFLINSLGTVSILAGIGWLLDKEWIMNFLRQVFASPEPWSMTTTFHIFETWLGPNGRNLAWALVIFLGLYLLLEWVISFLNNEHHFIWTLSLTFVISFFVGLPADLDHQVLLLLPVLLTARAWETRWKSSGRHLSLGYFLLLLAGNWFLVFSGLQAASPNAVLMLYYILPLIVLVGMIWTRWWYLRLIELPGQRWRSIRRG